MGKSRVWSILLHLAGAVAALSVLHGEDLAAQEALRDGTQDAAIVDINLTRFQRSSIGGLETATFYYKRSGARYLRLSFGHIDIKTGDTLVVSGANPNVRVVREGPINSISKDLTNIFVMGDRVRVGISSKKISEADLSISSLHYQDRSIFAWKSIYDKDDMISINDLAIDDAVLKIRRSIVFISFMLENEMKSCSGFLVQRDLVMTNFHCINDVATCGSAQIVFDYERDRERRVSMGATRRCVEVLAKGKGLDFSIIRLDAAADVSIPTLRLAALDAKVGDLGALVQHPGGDYKKVAEIGCEVLHQNAPGGDENDRTTDFTHRCDTIKGSSGSPIVQASDPAAQPDCVIGLHHWGFVSGSAYATLNRAVRAPLIVNAAQAQGLTLDKCSAPEELSQ